MKLYFLVLFVIFANGGLSGNESLDLEYWIKDSGKKHAFKVDFLKADDFYSITETGAGLSFGTGFSILVLSKGKVVREIFFRCDRDDFDQVIDVRTGERKTVKIKPEMKKKLMRFSGNAELGEISALRKSLPFGSE